VGSAAIRIAVELISSRGPSFAAARGPLRLGNYPSLRCAVSAGRSAACVKSL
jgi:hypothetical protein